MLVSTSRIRKGTLWEEFKCEISIGGTCQFCCYGKIRSFPTRRMRKQGDNTNFHGWALCSTSLLSLCSPGAFQISASYPIVYCWQRAFPAKDRSDDYLRPDFLLYCHGLQRTYTMFDIRARLSLAWWSQGATIAQAIPSSDLREI